jgi:hypothetical protein
MGFRRRLKPEAPARAAVTNPKTLGVDDCQKLSDKAHEKAGFSEKPAF